jgi:YHS domain-containing protein
VFYVLKLLIFVLAAFLLYKLFTGDKRKKVVEKNEEVKKKVADGIMVKDPICGTFVSKESDIRVRKGDEVLCFCSYDCREKYVQQLEASTTSESGSKPQ